MPPHHPALHARDAGSIPDFKLPPLVIVLFIMIGALIFVCMGYAIHRTFGFGHDPNGYKHTTVQQMEYMAEVRVRNMDALEREGRWARSEGTGRREGETVY
ncbi:hypothetical protein FB567DRAFT_493928 [Paraphoma chrysanthemicola]|uniref:Uncharacterized protein n=1 Tax=Paraphoma chrysanthemicola TaxID=798071 RepID=A0A8K0R9A0_9PLEO|nr:hypothetical protein FB567DRAFT_493928 [Paraphoma chrysanthemicola]